MTIAIFGSGYVGLVTGTCFAAAGVEVDVTPFVGPGLMRVGGCGHAAAPF